jgi:hypothetical protein
LQLKIDVLPFIKSDGLPGGRRIACGMTTREIVLLGISAADLVLVHARRWHAEHHIVVIHAACR